MSAQRLNGSQVSPWRAVLLALHRSTAMSRPAFALPAGAVLPTTSLPPAFTARQRAVVEGFFGRR